MKRCVSRFCGLLTILAICGVGVISNSFLAFANNEVDLVNIVVPSSCSFSDEQIPDDSEHSATMHNNEYKSEIGATTFKTYCSDNNGYAVYAIGYSNDEYSNTEMIHEEESAYNFGTGTATSGSASNWSMKLLPVAGIYAPTILSDTNGVYTDYHVVPSAYTKVATFDARTDTPVDGETGIGSAFQATYAVWISSAQAPGTYTGKVKYTLVHPANAEAPVSPQPSTAGCINYHANASNAVGTMGCQSTRDGASVTLLASNFSREGYGFAGWSDAYDYVTNLNANFYGPMETITVPEGTTANGLSLYAVWVPSAGSLQDQTKVAELCGNPTQGIAGSLIAAPTDGTANLSSVSALTDQRDGQTYAIAKLADGNCWMIENLRLEAEGTRTAEKQALAQGYGTSSAYGNFGGLADAEFTNFSNSITANSLYYSGTQSSDAVINIGTSNYPGYRMPRYNNTNTSTRASSPTSSFAAAMYSYGNYYTWHAAIADLTYNGTNGSSATSTSLCPSGWRLPQGGNKSRIASNDDSDFWNLVVDALNNGVNPANYSSQPQPYYTGNAEAGPISNRLRSYPNNFIYSGLAITSSATGGQNGLYWSSTAGNATLGYRMSLNNTAVYPGTNANSKSYGCSIRCIAEF